jgi:hypothetical protein
MNMLQNGQLEFDVVASVIRQWDPYGLLRKGCPNDEFDREIQSIVQQIPRIHSPADSVHAVSRTFSSSFDNETFGAENCREVGEQLFAALERQGFIRV